MKTLNTSFYLNHIILVIIFMPLMIHMILFVFKAFVTGYTCHTKVCQLSLSIASVSLSVSAQTPHLWSNEFQWIIQQKRNVIIQLSLPDMGSNQFRNWN